MKIVDKAKEVAQGVAMAAVAKAVRHAPDSWIPGGKPDPLIRQQHGQIGQPLSRLDGPLKVTGAAPFAAEFAIPGMTYAALAFSTIAKGRILTLDSGAAEAAPGVVLVMTYKNAPRLQPPPLFMTAEKAGSGSSLPVMQDDAIHWNGEPIALVLAESQEQADHAASLVHASYVVEEATTAFAVAKAAGTEPGTFAGQPLKLEIGDAEAALAAAAHRVDAVYRTPRHNHNAIEPHAVTLAWDGGQLFAHDSTQGVMLTAWSLGQIFGIEEAQVHITSPFVGGGFGSKTLWPHQILAAAAAKLAGRPVRMALSREGIYRVVGGRTLTEQRVALGADAEGKLAALIHSGTTAMTQHNALPEPFILPSKGAYTAGAFKLGVEVAYVDMVANTFMRAPGESVGTFALECAVDELAHALAQDPIELRVRNEPARDPTSGLPFSSRNIVAAYRSGAERFGWDKRNVKPGTRREGEWLIGLGCATGTYPYHRMPGGAARITLTREGDATIEIAAHEMGMGTATAQTQIAADRLGLPIDRIAFRYGSSSLPGNVLAGGSQQTAAVGAAVIAAHRKLVIELIKLAGNDSPLSGLGSEEVISINAGLCKADARERYESYAAILRRAGRDAVTVEADAPMPLELMHWSMHSHSAVFCEARVNVVTGEPRVTRLLGSFDCGRIINPKMAASQFRGGMIMGLGLALTEETLFDERSGRIMNPSLAEYHVPVHADIPEIDVIWTDIPDPHTPMGARGIGEIGITGTGAAIANAIFNATGKRVRELPITLDKLL